jgi:cation-transporting P-type ATPase E
MNTRTPHSLRYETRIPFRLLGPSNGPYRSRRHATTYAAQGERVLLLSTAPDLPAGEPGNEIVPPTLEPVGVLRFAEQVRPDAAETLQYFEDQDVVVKVISGDSAATVAAAAHRLGLGNAHSYIDAQTLPTDPDEFAAAIQPITVFGRVTPDQKRDIVKAILLDNKFANLFLTKTVTTIALALATAIAALSFPFLPRHLSLISTLTIGIPAFALSFREATARARPGFVRRVLRFSVPSGLVLATVVTIGYRFSRSAVSNSTLVEARTAATLAAAAMGFWILLLVARPLTKSMAALIAGLTLSLEYVFVPDTWVEFYEVDVPARTDLIVVAGTVGVGIVARQLIFAGLRNL